jgi:hypothetical protein
VEGVAIHGIEPGASGYGEGCGVLGMVECGSALWGGRGKLGRPGKVPEEVVVRGVAGVSDDAGRGSGKRRDSTLHAHGQAIGGAKFCRADGKSDEATLGAVEGRAAEGRFGKQRATWVRLVK